MTTVTTYGQKPGDSKAPDYSTMERSKIPVEYTWNIADLYATKEDVGIALAKSFPEMSAKMLASILKAAVTL